MRADAALNETDLDRNLDRSRSSDGLTESEDAALVRAIDRASAAGRFDVVALLAGELQARRLAREGVAALDTKKRQRGA